MLDFSVNVCWIYLDRGHGVLLAGNLRKDVQCPFEELSNGELLNGYSENESPCKFI